MPWESLGRIALSALLGAAIGLERRIQAQPAGMRTQMVIAACCCLTMDLWGGTTETGRIIQAVLTGIGFLGGGSILKSGLSVHGLTTAATIWASATIGLTVGASHFFLAAALTAIVTLGLLALNPIEKLLSGRRDLRRIILESRDVSDPLGQVRPLLARRHIRLEEVGIAHRFQEQRQTLTLVVACPEDLSFPDVVRDIGAIPGMVEVRVE
jgi:putative Mg2+ transporter-C (MgtC) family protein